MEIHTSNCPKCGSVFRQNLRNLCSSCIQEENIFLDRCSNYLWKHPSTHTRQLSDVTGTPIELLTDWVRAGKFPPHTVSLIILVNPAVPLFMQEDFAIPAWVHSVRPRWIFKPVCPAVQQQDYSQLQGASKAIKPSCLCRSFL